eukprot:gene3373-3833_t
MKKLILTTLLSLLSIYLLAQRNSEDASAYQYYEQGDYPKAAVLFGKLFESSKKEVYFDLYLNALLKTGQYQDAEKVVRKYLGTQAGNLKFEIAMGRIYQENGQTEKATKFFNQFIASLPPEEDKIRLYVNYLYRFQYYDLAISAFLQGRKMTGNDQMFAFELLNLYRYKKDKNALTAEYMNVLPTMPALLIQAQTNLSAVFEGSNDYLTLQALLLKKIQKDPDNETLNKLLIWEYLQRQEFEMALRQLIAQDKRLNHSDQEIFNMASTFISNGANATAIKAYEYLMAKGNKGEYYLPARIELINTKYYLLLDGKFEKTAVAELAAQYEALTNEFGKNLRTLFAMTRLANLEAYYLNNFTKAENALEEALKIPNLNMQEAGRIKLDLADIYVLNNEPWEAFLVYEQVARKFENQDIGNEAMFRSARLSFFQGNFAYAKSQADVLKASTSQLIANDALNLSLLISDNLQSAADSAALKMYADAQMLEFRKLPQKALIKLDSIAVAFPGNSLSDDILMAKSKLFIQQNNLSQAALMLQTIIDKHKESLWADDALFLLADLYENRLGKIEEARNLYQKLITDFPGSMYVSQARKHFRKLRGDAVDL